MSLAEKRRALQRKRLRAALDGLGTRDFRPGNPFMNAAIFHGLHETSRDTIELAEVLYHKDFNVLACDFPQIAPTEDGLPKKMTQLDKFIDFFIDHILPKAPKEADNISDSVVTENNTVPTFEGLLRVGKVLTYELLNSQSRGKYPTVLIGYSIGALTIIRLLQSRPSLCEKLHGIVCINAPLRVDHNISKKIQARRFIIEPLLAILIKRRPHILVSNPDYSDEEQDGKYALSLETRKKLTLYVAVHIYWQTLDVWKYLDRLKVDSLFFHGISDGVAPLSAVKDAVLQMPQGFRRDIFEYDCGHDIFTAYPKINFDIAHILKESLDK